MRLDEKLLDLFLAGLVLALWVTVWYGIAGGFTR